MLGTNLDASGPFGGPFTPASVTCTLTNSGDAALDWTAAKAAPWLTLSGSGGTLAVFGEGNVATPTIEAASTVTRSNDTITFTNTTTGRGNAARSVNLTIVLPAPCLRPSRRSQAGRATPWRGMPSSGPMLATVGRNATDAAFTSPVSSGWIART